MCCNISIWSRNFSFSFSFLSLSFDFVVIVNLRIFAMHYRIHYFSFSSWEGMYSDQINFLPLLSFRTTKFCWILSLSRKRQWWCAIERDTKFIVARSGIDASTATKKKRNKERERSEEARTVLCKVGRSREHANAAMSRQN